MNPETSSSTTITSSTALHCQHRSASGSRFCRMAISDQDSGLCSRHAALLQKDLHQADPAAALIGDIQEFRSAADINHSLGELYKLQARNKISPRRAAVMAYTCNLLLRTLPASALESAPAKEETRIIIDMPAPTATIPGPKTPPTRTSAHDHLSRGLRKLARTQKPTWRITVTNEPIGEHRGKPAGQQSGRNHRRKPGHRPSHRPALRPGGR